MTGSASRHFANRAIHPGKELLSTCAKECHKHSFSLVDHIGSRAPTLLSGQPRSCVLAVILHSGLVAWRIGGHHAGG